MVNEIITKLLKFGLTQTEIAKRANVPQSRISEIVNEKAKTISFESGKRLEALLHEVQNEA